MPTTRQRQQRAESGFASQKGVLWTGWRGARVFQEVQVGVVEQLFVCHGVFFYKDKANYPLPRKAARCGRLP